MDVYRILENKDKKLLAVEKGYCWGAAILGTFWTLYKGFWPGAAILALLHSIAANVSRYGWESRSSSLVVIGIFLTTVFAYLAGRYANFAYLAFLTGNEYQVIASVNSTSVEGALKRYSETPVEGTGAATEGVNGTGVLRGECPNCSSPLPLDAEECNRCKAQFGPSSTWKVQRSTEV